MLAGIFQLILLACIVGIYLQLKRSRAVKEGKTVSVQVARALMLPFVVALIGWLGSSMLSMVDPSYAAGCGSNTAGACFGLGMLLFFLTLIAVPATIVGLILYVVSTKKRDAQSQG
jgi:hypothetical protein